VRNRLGLNGGRARVRNSAQNWLGEPQIGKQHAKIPSKVHDAHLQKAFGKRRNSAWVRYNWFTRLFNQESAKGGVP
jgi:hypothetical protein